MLKFSGIKIEEYSPCECLQNYQTSKKIGIILKGKAVIQSGEDGAILKKLSKNDIFGVASLFDSHFHLTKVVSTTKTTL